MGVGGVVKGIGSRVPSHAPSVGRDGEAGAGNAISDHHGPWRPKCCHAVAPSFLVPTPPLI